jgi:hypothetical protein
MPTIRQQLIALLENHEMSAREISRELHISEKEVFSHLQHIRKSVKALKKKLVVEPFECLQCGYVFKDRQRLSPPGRCPRCKHSRIKTATYRIA